MCFVKFREENLDPKMLLRDLFREAQNLLLGRANEFISGSLNGIFSAWPAQTTAAGSVFHCGRHHLSLSSGSPLRGHILGTGSVLRGMKQFRGPVVTEDTLTFSLRGLYSVSTFFVCSLDDGC